MHKEHSLINALEAQTTDQEYDTSEPDAIQTGSPMLPDQTQAEDASTSHAASPTPS
ncbi:hypothetical protein DPMN_022237 [Dreissena polymorpha]|uniref:Uncharacterized protein n=1 Tax=Dreissena polymorpha TaxID=45954 RepID=A0A9D4NM71_DREPO|nr:hypothetical protein DPMN_022237 [Dreissena polymorpha]